MWALLDYGFRVVISSRFADIFRGNAGKAGLLAADVTQDDVELLWKLIEEQPGMELVVDLPDRTVTAGTVVLPFDIDDYTGWRLLEGLDDIGLTLRNRRHRVQKREGRLETRDAAGAYWLDGRNQPSGTASRRASTGQWGSGSWTFARTT